MEITIAICVYNEERNLDKLLKSLSMQESVQYDLVIVDDGSEDNTAEILSEYQTKLRNGCKIYHRQHEGLRPSRKFAIEICKTKYVMTIDADCRFTDRNSLKEMLSEFKSEDIFAVQGHILSYVDTQNIVSSAITFSDELFYRSIFTNKTDVRTLLGGAVIYDRSKLMSLGGLTDGDVGEDTDIARKAKYRGWRMIGSSAIIQHAGIPVRYKEYLGFNLRKGSRSAHNFKGHYREMLFSISILKFIPLISGIAAIMALIMSLMLSSSLLMMCGIILASPLVLIVLGGYYYWIRISIPNKSEGFLSPLFIVYENMLWAIGFISETIKGKKSMASFSDDNRFQL